MKRKSILLLVVLMIISLFTVVGCGKETKKEDKKEVITPLLYEVTKEGSSNKIYILGTIHIGSLKNTKFADYVTKAFDESHYVAAEVDNEVENDDPEESLNEMMKMLYSDGDNIKNHMSSENYDKLMKFIDDNKLDDGMFNKDNYKLEYYSRVLTQFVIEKSGLSVEEGIDEYFVNKAKKENKELLIVEGDSYQEEVLSSLPDKLYENMIISSIDDLDGQIKEAEDSFKEWKRGDEKEIWKDDGSSIKEEDKANYSEEDLKLAEEFDEKILYSRNITMTDKLEEYFNNNYDVFFMVGQDHVKGDKGIVTYLRQRGYTVKVVK